MAVIHSGNSTDQLQIDSVSKAARTTLYSSSGNELTSLPVSSIALTSIDAKTPALVAGRQPVDGSGVTQPVSALSLPLPSGAATEATLQSIATAVGAASTLTISVTATLSGDTVIIAAPGAGLAITVKNLSLSCTTNSISPSLREGLGGTIKKAWRFSSAYNFNEVSGWKLPSNTALVLALSSAASVAVNIEYSVSAG